MGLRTIERRRRAIGSVDVPNDAAMTLPKFNAAESER